MAWVANASLASAVSNAGGLGIIAAMNSNAEQLTAEIKKTRSLLGSEVPFGVNVMLMSPFADEVSDVVIEQHVPIVTTGAGNPTKYMKKWIEAGIKVIPVVPSTAFAKIAQRGGASAVIAEGCESGGHIGELTTMALVPQVCDVVSIPVIAAGGIADGRGMAAALMLGACGVQIGTRFLVAKECTIHQNYKDKVLAANDIATVVTGKRLGHPVRTLRNQFSKKFAERESDPTITDEELEKLGAGTLRNAVVDGDIINGSMMAGQISGLINKEQTCAEIIDEIISEASALLKGASL
jgi:enoyl-[acyl-carrier protein] reductase II